MATISSVFKMQDKASRIFNKVSDSIDTVIDRADELSNKTSTMGSGISSMNPALVQAISKYQDLNAQSDSLAQKSALLQKQERLLVKELRDQKNGYSQNEKAILGIENKLFGVRKNLDQIEKKGTKLTDEIQKQAILMNNIANNIQPVVPIQDQISQGFSTWQTKLIMFNQTLQAVRSIANGVKRVMDFSDSIVLGSNRLGLINDGLQTTKELQEKIFAAAERSRGSYDDMAKSVAKLGMLAPDAFNNNDEMIAFSEMMQKSFKVSGASQQEISSATYQLTQAMAAGRLQGDEFRSIMENAPMLADAIAKYMGKSKGELREMSREGLITADVIKAAMFTAADDINAQYEQMPRTFADMTQSIKNTAQLEFTEVANKISDILNNEKVIAFMSKIEKGIGYVADAALWMVDRLTAVVGFLYDHGALILSMMGVIAVYMVASMIPAVLALTKALFLKAAAWAAAHWQILAVLGIMVVAYAIFQSTDSILTTLAWTILIVAGAFALWNAVQWALNGALYACPIVWIIVLVIALVAAVFLFMQWMAKATGLAGSGLGMIAGGVNVVIQFFKNLGLEVANIAVGIWNALGACAENIGIAFRNTIRNIKSWFYGMLSTVMDVIGNIVESLNKLPFIDIDVSGIESKAKEYADKKAEAENSKEAYKSVTEAFNEGMSTFETFQDGWVQDAFNSGAAWGDKLNQKIESFDPGSALSGLLGGEDPADKYGAYDYEALLDANGNVPVDVKNSKEVNISDEDLKMLKDIATREYMLNYKHVTPNVTIEFGDIRETADVNQVRDAISKMMEEELAELYVVEEA